MIQVFFLYIYYPSFTLFFLIYILNNIYIYNINIYTNMENSFVSHFHFNEDQLTAQ